MVRSVGVLLVLMILAGIGAFAFVKMGYFPINADAEPSGIERHLAGIALDSAIQRLAPKEDNPTAINDDNLIAGARLYKEDCMECHGGPDGTHKTFGRSLYPSAPNFSQRAEDWSDGQIFYAAKHGIRLTGMPSFAKMATDEEIWKIAAFIKRMTKLPPAVDAEFKRK